MAVTSTASELIKFMGVHKNYMGVHKNSKCTPCRIGSVRGVEIIDKIRRGDQRQANLELLDELCETMVEGSLCAMGGLTPFPVRSALKYFPEDFYGEFNRSTQHKR